MKSKSGFTLIELIIVLAILGVLVVIAAFNYTGVQRQTRDTQRSSSAILIAESLEEYFAKNGEYPSVTKMTATDGNSVKTLLNLSNTDSLLAPFAVPGTSNSWKSGTATQTNPLTYNGNTDFSPSCATGTAVTDACADFRIQYHNEQTDSIATIYSRNTSTLIDVTTVTGIAAPSAPSLSATLNGGNIVATATVVTCEQGTSARYAFRSRTNNGSWSAYSTWGTMLTTSTPAAQGTLYGFQVRASCLSNTSSNSSAASLPSNEATYTYQVATPSAPVLSIAPAADNNSATWSWSPTSCPAGTTAQYVTTFYRDDASGWRAYNFSATQTTTSITYATNYEGYEHRAKAQVRCSATYGTSAWSADSNSPAFVHPVTAVDPTNFRWSTYNGSPLFTWTEPSCQLGTQQERRYWYYVAGTQYFANGSTSTNAWMYDIFNSTRSGATAQEQWQNNAPLLTSQLEMTIVNQKGYTPTSVEGAGWTVNTGSPNTNSQNDTAVRTVAQLRCINTTTGRNAVGNYVMSGMFTR